MATDQQRDVSQLLCNYLSVVSESDADIERTAITDHKIMTGSTQPINRRPVHMYEEADRQLITWWKRTPCDGEDK